MNVGNDLWELISETVGNAPGPGEAILVKDKVKNQRKPVCFKEIMPREKQIG